MTSSLHHLQFLRRIALHVSDEVIRLILVTDFSEWGGMLLHQETIGLVEAIEVEAAAADITVRPWFSKLLWALNILTLDQVQSTLYLSIHDPESA